MASTTGPTTDHRYSFVQPIAEALAWGAPDFNSAKAQLDAERMTAGLPPVGYLPDNIVRECFRRADYIRRHMMTGGRDEG